MEYPTHLLTGDSGRCVAVSLHADLDVDVSVYSSASLVHGHATIRIRTLEQCDALVMAACRARTMLTDQSHGVSLRPSTVPTPPSSQVPERDASAGEYQLSDSTVNALRNLTPEGKAALRSLGGAR